MENLQNQNQQNNFNQISQQNSKKKIPSWLGFVIIIVLALVAFGGVFAYQYFTKSQQNSQFLVSRQKTDQTQTQTAGWKTYTNTEYGFEFQYPSVFETPDESNNSSIIVEFNMQNGFNLSKTEYSQENPKTGIVDFATLKQFALKNNPGGETIKDITVDGVNGFEIITGLAEDNVKNLEADFPFDSTSFISFSAQMDQQYFNQIISTFKFTTSTSQTIGQETSQNLNPINNPLHAESLNCKTIKGVSYSGDLGETQGIHIISAIDIEKKVRYFDSYYTKYGWYSNSTSLSMSLSTAKLSEPIAITFPDNELIANGYNIKTVTVECDLQKIIIKIPRFTDIKGSGFESISGRNFKVLYAGSDGTTYFDKGLIELAAQ